jgi:hypothetical protein
MAVDNFLLDEGFVDKEDLLAALSKYYNTPAFDVDGYFFDHRLLLEFPKGFLLRNMIIPVAVFAGDNILTVVCNDPSDASLLPKIGEHVSYDLDLLVGIAPRITSAVKEFYDDSLTVTDDLEYVPAEEREEKIALEMAKRKIDRRS